MPSEYEHIRVPGQDDDGIDCEGLRRQQLDAHAVGVTLKVADAEHPDAFLAQYHVVGPLRRRGIGSVQIGTDEIPIQGLAQVDLVTGHKLNAGDSIALPTRAILDEFHADDLPRQTLIEALTTEDLAEVAPGAAINQVRKGKTTRRMRPIR